MRADLTFRIFLTTFISRWCGARENGVGEAAPSARQSGEHRGTGRRGWAHSWAGTGRARTGSGTSAARTFSVLTATAGTKGAASGFKVPAMTATAGAKGAASRFKVVVSFAVLTKSVPLMWPKIGAADVAQNRCR